MLSFLRRIVATCVLLVLFACGGGGGGGEGGSAGAGESENSAPVADAGSDLNVSTADLVALDASGSFDADDDILSYFWSFKSLPNGSNTTLSDPFASDPTFSADLEGNYVLELIVNDGVADSLSDTITITATTSPPLEISGFAKWPYNMAEIKYDFESDGIDWVEEFTYDQSGNVLTSKDGTDIYYYNYENGLLKSIDGPYGTATFKYSNGKLIESHVGNDLNSKYEYANENVSRLVNEYDGGYETIDYTYNEYGMTTIEHIKWYEPDGSLSDEDVLTYTYDVKGKLIKISCPHEVTNYFYNESGVLNRFERSFDQNHIVGVLHYDDQGYLTLEQNLNYGETTSSDTYYIKFNENGFPSEHAAFASPSNDPFISTTIYQLLNWID